MAEEEDHILAEVSDNGTRVRMLDGSEWRIEGAGVDVSTGWLPGDGLVLRRDGETCEIVNGDETVSVQPIA